MRTPSSSSLALSASVLALVIVAGCGGSSKPPEVASSEETNATADGAGKASSFSVPSITTSGKAELVPGKVTIVDFWATWCEPCKKSFPKLQELYVKYKASGLEIVAISVDDEKGGLSAFANAHGAKFPIGWDEGKKIADKWKPEAMPSTFIVDKNGVIRHVHKGYHDGEESEIEKEIKALF